MSIKNSNNRFHARPILGWLPSEQEKGNEELLVGEKVLSALHLAKRGEVFDLDVGRWPGFPLYKTEPPFQVLTYRTPNGLRVDNIFPEWTAAPTKPAWNSEILIAGTHSGTHIDAFSHLTIGEKDHWYGGFTAQEHLGDFGPTTADTCAIPPIVGRGLLIDVAGHLGVEVLPGNHIITLDEIQGALDRQNSEIKPGDSVLIRTGYLSIWDTEEGPKYFGSGIGIEAASWLADQEIVLIGADNEGVEHLTFREEDLTNPIPVHIEMLVQRGIYLLEMVYLEELVKERKYEFLFLCLTPKTRGTTGAFLRPVAIL